MTATNPVPDLLVAHCKDYLYISVSTLENKRACRHGKDSFTFVDYPSQTPSARVEDGVAVLYAKKIKRKNDVALSCNYLSSKLRNVEPRVTEECDYRGGVHAC